MKISHSLGCVIPFFCIVWTVDWTGQVLSSHTCRWVVELWWKKTEWSFLCTAQCVDISLTQFAMISFINRLPEFYYIHWEFSSRDQVSVSTDLIIDLAGPSPIVFQNHYGKVDFGSVSHFVMVGCCTFLLHHRLESFICCITSVRNITISTLG